MRPEGTFVLKLFRGGEARAQLVAVFCKHLIGIRFSGLRVAQLKFRFGRGLQHPERKRKRADPIPVHVHGPGHRTKLAPASGIKASVPLGGRRPEEPEPDSHRHGGYEDRRDE